jgi:hypothetical protein
MKNKSKEKKERVERTKTKRKNMKPTQRRKVTEE